MSVAELLQISIPRALARQLSQMQFNPASFSNVRTDYHDELHHASNQSGAWLTENLKRLLGCTHIARNMSVLELGMQSSHLVTLSRIIATERGVLLSVSDLLQTESIQSLEITVDKRANLATNTLSRSSEEKKQVDQPALRPDIVEGAPLLQERREPNRSPEQLLALAYPCLTLATRALIFLASLLALAPFRMALVFSLKIKKSILDSPVCIQVQHLAKENHHGTRFGVTHLT
ncbi:hypothetical protein N9O24_00805 [bacterium]|nr:hypothetical protein [bacterium]